MGLLTYKEFLENCNVLNYSIDYYNSKVVHCIKLHESIEKRVAFSSIKKDAIQNILEQKKEAVDGWREQLIRDKSISNGPVEKFQYININISSDFTLEMLINEFFSHIHSIFDLVAFLINETILQRSIKSLNGVSYHKVIERLGNDNQHQELLKILEDIKKSDWYKYIDDFNNLAKHRYLANITSASYLDTGEIMVKISEFERKEKHEEIEAFDVIYICFDEVLMFLRDVFQYVKQGLPNINFNDRYHRDDMYYKIQMSDDPSTRGANAFLITGNNTYKQDDELYINIATKDKDSNKIKISDRNHALRVFLKNNREDELPYAAAEHVSDYKLRSLQDYTKYRVRISTDIKKDMALDFFEPKVVHGSRLTDDITLLTEK